MGPATSVMRSNELWAADESSEWEKASLGHFYLVSRSKKPTADIVTPIQGFGAIVSWSFGVRIGELSSDGDCGFGTARSLTR